LTRYTVITTMFYNQGRNRIRIQIYKSWPKIYVCRENDIFLAKCWKMQPYS